MQRLNTVLLTLNISSFDPNCFDTDASKDVANQKGIESQEMCRVYKSLFPRNDEFKKIRATLSAIRQYHYLATHAWHIEGQRIIAVDRLSEYREHIATLTTALNEHVEAVAQKWNQLIEAARPRLGELFRLEDYPTADGFRDSFKVQYRVHPMPVANEMTLIGLSDNEIAQLHNQCQQDSASAYRKAHQAMWGDATDKLKNFIKLLADNKRAVSERSVQTVVSAMEDSVRYALVKDEQFQLALDSVSAAFITFDGQRLKVDDDARHKLLTELRSILSFLEDARDQALQDHFELSRAA